jgi:hypothetical protein
MPGIDGAHEKGGVEQEGGRFRRQHLVPVPDVASLDELNETIAAIDRDEDERILHGRLTTIGFNFAVEADNLAPLPDEDFECGLVLNPLVSKNSRVTVRQCYYSVPARFIGRQLRVVLRANDVAVYDRRQLVAHHPRLTKRGDWHDDLDHFLEILLAKPGALGGSTALAQARTEGVFTEVHEAFWALAREKRGEAEGTRLLIEVLLMHRHMDPAHVTAGITRALEADAASPELVAVEARKAAAQAEAAEPVPEVDENGEPLPWIEPAPAPGRLLALPAPRPQLPGERPPPSVDIYDQLLSRRPKGPA